MNQKECVGLSALSRRQQKLVERHLPLVRVSLRRLDERSGRTHHRRDAHELMQEASLALVEAVRSHDPAQHGRFSAYAVARMHFAMSRFAHESKSLIRVPFTTQRRRRALSRDRHHPDAPPQSFTAKRDSSYRALWTSPRGSQGAALNDQIRECYERAMTKVVEKLKSADWITGEDRALIDLCSRERWAVPESHMRTSLRELLRKTRCSMGRLTRWDERFRKRMSQELVNDPVFRELVDVEPVTAPTSPSESTAEPDASPSSPECI